MSDIFREVEEDVRRERFEKLWKAYGNYAIAALVLLFAGIAGWQVWERHDAQERAKVSDAFMAAQRITNPQAQASAMLDLARTAPKGYASVARLAEAGAMFASGQQGNAIALYKEIAANDNGPVGSAARLRAAWGLLAPLNQTGNAWRENAREILAYADYRAMDTKSALAKYTALSVNAEAPDALRTRAKAMAAFLKNGGAMTFGSVPADATPLPPPQAANPSAPAAAPAAPPKK